MRVLALIVTLMLSAPALAGQNNSGNVPYSTCPNCVTTDKKDLPTTPTPTRIVVDAYDPPILKERPDPAPTVAPVNTKPNVVVDVP